MPLGPLTAEAIHRALDGLDAELESRIRNDNLRMLFGDDRVVLLLALLDAKCRWTSLELEQEEPQARITRAQTFFHVGLLVGVRLAVEEALAGVERLAGREGDDSSGKGRSEKRKENRNEL